MFAPHLVDEIKVTWSRPVNDKNIHNAECGEFSPAGRRSSVGTDSVARALMLTEWHVAKVFEQGSLILLELMSHLRFNEAVRSTRMLH